MPLNLRGFGAFITSEGKELEQYATEVQGEKTVTCWIASEAGKEFKVHWEDYMGETHSSAEIRTDGRVVGNMLSTLGGSTVLSAWRNTAETQRPFQFAKLNLTDDDSIASPKTPVSEDLGTIEVRIRRVREYTAGASFVPSTSGHTEIGPVHERSKKAGTNCVALGTEIRVPRINSIVPTYMDDGPYVIFRFRHRQQGILQANGIMPLPPPERADPPSTSRIVNKKRPSSEDGNPPKRARTTADDDLLIISDDDNDDVVALEAQLARLQKKLQKKKSEKSSHIVKRERSPIRGNGSLDEVIEIFSD